MGVKASVIIPTKNAGPLFRQVLDAASEQETPWPYEIIVVDSGSSDGTVAYAREKKVRVLEIAPESFGHGRTRNYAVGQSIGEFALVITHDALPASRTWLAGMVAAVEQAPDIAGAFGRHLAYPDCDPYTARDLALHFENCRAIGAVRRIEDRKRFNSDDGYRQGLHFFSDNNACLRRSVWERHPYPDVEFAEDQIWARTVLEAGYAIAYADDAAVFHSHSYSVFETGRRAYDESAALHRLFGYDLCPSLKHLAVQTYRCSARDICWSLAQRDIVTQAPWIVRAPFANFARLAGHYLGRRDERLPDWFAQRISRDRALKNTRRVQAPAAGQV